MCLLVPFTNQKMHLVKNLCRVLGINFGKEMMRAKDGDRKWTELSLSGTRFDFLEKRL